MIIIVLIIILLGILLGKFSGKVVRYSEDDALINKVSCHDSDGKDVTKFGTVMYTTISGRVQTIDDECGMVSDARFSGAYVHEGYCDGTKWHRDALPCPDESVCIDGACVSH